MVGSYLLFSDTRGNKIWKWQNYTQSVFLDKSGCTSEKDRCNGVKEPGKFGGRGREQTLPILPPPIASLPQGH